MAQATQNGQQAKSQVETLKTVAPKKRVTLYVGLEGAQHRHEDPKAHLKLLLDQWVPGGYTVHEGEGRWHDGTRFIQEETMVVTLVVDTDRELPFISLVDEIKKELNQEEVMVTTEEVKVGFW